MMTDYNSTYLGRVVNALSQLGNALAGGNPDISVSARIGYMNYSLYVPSCLWFWKACQSMVDFSFYPIDGPGHCKGAYQADKKENYKVGQGWILGLVIMSILMIVVCALLLPITWFYQLVKYLKNG